MTIINAIAQTKLQLQKRKTRLSFDHLNQKNYKTHIYQKVWVLYWFILSFLLTFLLLLFSMLVKVINKSKHSLPKYETLASAGVDIRANIDGPIHLKAFERVLVKTGLFLEIPAGFEAQVRPRSGLALKKGVTVLNAPGTIDADYRGEVGVILINLSQEEFVIEDGERIAQLVFAKFEQAQWKETETLSNTQRGEGGFGSTGVK